MGRGEGAGDIECMLAGEGASEGFGPKGTGLNRLSCIGMLGGIALWGGIGPGGGGPPCGGGHGGPTELGLILW